jgi:UDP-N-acetylmuramoyl-tripeptide--D-alanyl-D-alanine ligase
MDTADFYKKYFTPGKISTDSRSIRPGDIFFALKGENFNGSEFARNALELGASVAVVEHDYSSGADNRIERVENTLTFLQDLAKHHRKLLNLNVIGLTGSNGKTTTKELIKHVLHQKFKVHSTPGNLNNHIGVPLTLLSVDAGTDITIIEMGASHPGEIRELCQIAHPQSGLITNIGKAHLEGFGDFDGVKKAKSEMYDFLKANKGKIYVNSSDVILMELIGNYQNTVLYNASRSSAAANIVTSFPSLSIEITESVESKYMIHTNLYGDYNLSNILAAVAIGRDFGLDMKEIKAGIEGYYPESYRSQSITIGKIHIIADCYNANPTSMELALINFASYEAAKKVVILGGMKELGNHEKDEHRKIGTLLQQLRFDKVLLLGKEFEGIIINNSVRFDSLADLEEYLRQLDINESAILIKGSRSNKLERIIELIRKIYSSDH